MVLIIILSMIKLEAEVDPFPVKMQTSSAVAPHTRLMILRDSSLALMVSLPVAACSL